MFRRLRRWLRRPASTTDSEPEDETMSDQQRRGVNTRLADHDGRLTTLESEVETMREAVATIDRHAISATAPNDLHEAIETLRGRLDKLGAFARLFRFTDDEVQIRTARGWVKLEVVDSDGDGVLDVDLAVLPVAEDE